MKAKKESRAVKKAAAYQRLFETVDGKVVLKDLVDNHYFLRSTFSENVHETALREGQRNVLLYIFKMLSLDLNQLQEMMKEIDHEYSDGNTDRSNPASR